MHFKLRSLFATMCTCKNQGGICATYPPLCITCVIPPLCITVYIYLCISLYIYISVYHMCNSHFHSVVS